MKTMSVMTESRGKQMMRCSCLSKYIKYKSNANYANGPFDNLYALLARSFTCLLAQQRSRFIVYFSLTRTFQALMMIPTKKYWWCFCLFIYLLNWWINWVVASFCFKFIRRQSSNSNSKVHTHTQNHSRMANDFLSIFNKYCHCDVSMNSIVRWLHIGMYTKWTFAEATAPHSFWQIQIEFN